MSYPRDKYFISVFKIQSTGYESKSNNPALREDVKPSFSRAVTRKPTMMRRPTTVGQASSPGDISTHRLSVQMAPGEALLVGLRYGRQWDGTGGVELRLIHHDVTVMNVRQDLAGKYQAVWLKPGQHEIDAVEIDHFGDQEPAPRLNMALTIRCPGDLDEKSMARAEDFLRWVYGSTATISEGPLDMGRIPVAKGRLKADCALMIDGSAEYTIDDDISEFQFRFGLATLLQQSEPMISVSLEAEAEGKWKKVGDWILSDQGTAWKEVSLQPGAIPATCRRIRFTAPDSGDLVVLREPHFRPVADRGRKQKNIILIDLDTLRADRLGAYGYTERSTSARMDEVLKEKGFFVFKETHSASPWTLPSTAKFFTSRYRDFNDGQRVPRHYTVFSEILRERGYYCSAFTGGAALSLPGFEQGFHEYSSSKYLGKVEDVFPHAIQWLADWDGGPFFLFVHTYETHRPYTRNLLCRDLPRGRFGDPTDPNSFLPAGLSNKSEFTEQEKQYVDAVYDSCVRAATDAVADLFDQLEALGLWDSSVVVILSDHGEEFWDHFNVFGAHGHSLYGELLQVPLMIYSPEHHAGADSSIVEPVTLVDLVPTLFDLVDLSWDGPADGESLVPLLRNDNFQRRIPILAELRGPGADRVCIIADGFKYIKPVTGPATSETEQMVSHHYPYPAEPELYRLDDDPEESRNLYQTEQAAAGAMMSKLQNALSKSLPPIDAGTADQHTDIPDDVRGQLKELGYLQ